MCPSTHTSFEKMGSMTLVQIKLASPESQPHDTTSVPAQSSLVANSTVNPCNIHHILSLHGFGNTDLPSRREGDVVLVLTSNSGEDMIDRRGLYEARRKEMGEIER